MNPCDLCTVEFAEKNHRMKRQSYSNSGWCLEYVVLPLVGKNANTEKPLRTVFAFHGFARPLEDLSVLALQWPEAGALISVHLPHHGASGPIDPSFPEDAPLHPTILNQLLVEIAKKEGVDGPQYDLVGYSIGGRIALALFADSPQMWNRITLLAPDGLKKSPFYQLTVHSQLGKKLWFAIDRHADLVLLISDTLLKWRIISPHLHSFCAFHISNHEMRMMVWRGWRAHRLCWPKIREIAQALQDWSGRMDVAFGRHDRIIPLANGKRLQQLTRQNPGIHFHSLPCGHGMLKPEMMQKLIHRIFPT